MDLHQISHLPIYTGLLNRYLKRNALSAEKKKYY